MLAAYSTPFRRNQSVGEGLGVERDVERPRSDNEAVRSLREGGMLALWNLEVQGGVGGGWGGRGARQMPSVRLLRVAGIPSCCALCRGAEPQLAVAGTAEGSVQLWDLRQGDSRARSSHPKRRDSIIINSKRGAPTARTTSKRVMLTLPTGEALAVLSPAYCSEAHLCASHCAPVTAISLIEGAENQLTDTVDGLTVVSLSSIGELIVWIIVDGEPLEGDMDYGQAFGSRLRLMKSTAVSLDQGTVPREPHLIVGAAGAVLPICALCLSFLPHDHSRFLCGTDEGSVLHVSRYEDAPTYPRRFAPPYAPHAAVCALAACRSDPEWFLAGRADGSISLFHLSEPCPIREWQHLRGAVTQLAWAPGRAGLFWALSVVSVGGKSGGSSSESSGESVLHLFDNAKEERTPQLSMPLGTPPSADAADAATAHTAAAAKSRFALVSCSGRTMDTTKKSENQLLALSSASTPGKITVHVLEKSVYS